MLSRFDLIYLVLDTPHPDSDRRLAKHLVALYHPTLTTTTGTGTGEGQTGTGTGIGIGINEVIGQEFLRDYIAYARANIAPEVSEEAIEVLVQVRE